MKLHGMLWLFVIGVVAVLVIPAHAAAPDAQMLTLHSLLTEINTWELVDGLNLSQAQMQALLPVARQVRSEYEAVEAERTRSTAEFERGVRTLREELLANNGVSDEAKAAVARAEAGWREIEHQADERAPERLGVVRQTLTPEQMRFVANYQPGALLKGAVAQGAVAKAEQLLTRARQLSPQQLQRAPQALRRMLPPGIPPARLRAVAGDVRDIVMAARAMNDAEFEVQKGNLAGRLVALFPQRPVPSRGGTSAAVGFDSIEGKVGRMLLTPALATVLQARLGLAQPGPVKPPAVYPEQLASLVTDVRVLNLVNSLYLSDEQMKTLSGIIARADAEREAGKPQTDALLQGLIALATDVRAELAAGELSPGTLERVRTATAQATQEQRTRDARAAQYVGQVKQVLNENQITLVSEFIPCLIPVRNLTNPERIGQAQNTEGAERMLSAARTLPEERVEAMLPNAEERLRALLLRKHLPTAEVEAKLAELPHVIAEARAMSDTEFELKKSELIARVAPPEPAAVAGVALDRRIAQYLLCPNLLPILEQRGAAQEVASR